MDSGMSHEDDSLCYAIDSSKSIIQSNSPYVCKDNDEDSDEEIEVLLLDMKDQEDKSIWIDEDEYDLTEEQENYLLSEDCPEHYIKNLSISSINGHSAVDGKINPLFISETPLLENQSKMYGEEISKSDIINNSNSDIRKAKRNENLNISGTEENANMEDSSMVSNHEIKFNGSQCNYEIIQCYFSDVIEKEQYSNNSEDIESDIMGEEIYYDEKEDNSSRSFSSELFTEPTNVILLRNTSLSSKNTLTNSVLLENDEVGSNEKSKTEEKFVFDTSNKELVLSEIMSSDSARRVYLDLLKNKTHSLSISYNKYKSGYLQNPSRVIEQLELDKSLTKEESLSTELFYHSKKKVTKLLDNTNVSILDVESLNMFTANSETKLSTIQAENPVKKLTKSIFDSVQNPDEGLKQPVLKEKIQYKLLPQIQSEMCDSNMKAFTPETPMEEYTDYTPFVLASSATEEKPSHQDKTKSRCGDVKILSRTRQQNASTEDLCDLQECNIPNQLAGNKKIIIIPVNKKLNETFQMSPGARFTEMLNSQLYMGYESIDFQATNDESDRVQCSRCKSIIFDTDKNNSPHHPELNFRKNKTRNQVRKLKTNFNLQTLFDLFSLNNKIVMNILSVLLSKQFREGALLTDIMKCLRKEMAFKVATKLKQDIRHFLKAAVDAGILQMKYGRYKLSGDKKLSQIRNAIKILSKAKVKYVPNKILRILRSRNTKKR